MNSHTNPAFLPYLICFILIGFFSCKPAQSKESESHQDEKIFKPKGDLSDLVYNPVRPDGTIDSSFLPILVLDEVQFDFGTINEGDIVKKEFSFQNTGTAPLLILNASSSCGCTVPEWPKDPIAPGGRGVISVKFDSKNKEGYQNKEVTIFANTYPNRSIISVKGNVEKTK
jgi:hypothetical protein